ncbi:hypothetical protein NDU88_004441 [Pleurodeles waltl]|uniref:Uncharacterized protein n=1 Tax=Pleurodeles waltl TaxID=8319 RepID=A0AAV7MX73_PLEWA|nr:hypothetical protein NDU88_004441 [Pleurodeles waltl]
MNAADDAATMEQLNQSPGGQTQRSAPGSIYDFWLTEKKREDAGKDGREEWTKSRREESSVKEETTSRRSGDKGNKRGQGSEDDVEGRCKERLEGESRGRGDE